MRTTRKSYRCWPALGSGLLMLAGAVSSASAQNAGPQVLKLPNPTPRELTPDLRYHTDPVAPALAQRQLAAQNEKRWQLMLWATGEMVALSERAEKAAQAPSDDASKKQFEGNVVKIETLAKNLAAALKAN